MKTSELLWDKLRKNRIIALLAPQRPEQCVQAWEVLDPLGIVLEIALRTPLAVAGMSALRGKHADALFLAGTVMTGDDADTAIDAGAAGIVSPDYFPAVVEACVGRDVMCIPGGLNDAGKQLAQKAALYGCTPHELREHRPYQWLYKCFPAMTGNLVALEAAAAWKAVYADLTIVYTGGITPANVGEIVRRDPDAIVCGSALTRNVNDAARMRRDAERWLAAVDPARATRVRRPQGVFSLNAARGRPTVVTFGELMLRLSPPHGRRLGQASTMELTFGGAEANVAVALARWGARCRFVSAVPQHQLGDAAVETLRAHGVDTSHVLRCGDRLGIYFLEHGASQRPSAVIYDRAASSITGIRPDQIAWDGVFAGADWFHVTGITPALSRSLAQTVAEGIRKAKDSGVAVSLDLNYRAHLWSTDEAQRCLTPMLSHTDVLISNEADITQVLDIEAGAIDMASGTLNPGAYEEIARQAASRYGLRMVAITLRQSTSASDNLWSACLLDRDDMHWSRQYAVHVVDRVGGGDAFSAGLIWGLLSDQTADDALEFAVAASCLKQTIEGDFSLATTAEVEALARGETSGRIKR
jgi:2-dehydro-3-deoxygluconokinase